MLPLVSVANHQTWNSTIEYTQHLATGNGANCSWQQYDFNVTTWLPNIHLHLSQLKIVVIIWYSRTEKQISKSYHASTLTEASAINTRVKVIIDQIGGEKNNCPKDYNTVHWRCFPFTSSGQNVGNSSSQCKWRMKVHFSWAKACELFSPRSFSCQKF